MLFAYLGLPVTSKSNIIEPGKMILEILFNIKWGEGKVMLYKTKFNMVYKIALLKLNENFLKNEYVLVRISTVLILKNT